MEMQYFGRCCLNQQIGVKQTHCDHLPRWTCFNWIPAAVTNMYKRELNRTENNEIRRVPEPETKTEIGDALTFSSDIMT